MGTPRVRAGPLPSPQPHPGRPTPSPPLPSPQPHPSLHTAQDPPPATRALAHAEAAAAEIATLPPPFRDFFARRAIRALHEAAAAGEGARVGAAAEGGAAAGDGLGDRQRGAAEGLAAAEGWAAGGAGQPGELDAAGGPRVALSGGGSIPLLGLGTWGLGDDATAGAAVEAALAAGVRHFDCASIYRNEAAVGAALHAALASGRVARRAHEIRGDTGRYGERSRI